jgi:VWFA-related protein
LMGLPKIGGLLIVVLLMPPPGSSQSPSQGQTQGPAQSPAFRSDLNVVEIAVVAKDSNDSPITDLKKNDLRLFDNGVEQTILSFENLGDASVGNPGGPVPASAETPYQAPYQTTGRPRARLSVILLDTLNMSFKTQTDGRKAVSQMIEKLPQGRDKFAIFALDDSLHLLHDFSRDKASLLAAVGHYRGPYPRIGVDAATSAQSFQADHTPTAQAPGRGMSQGRMASMPVRSPSTGPLPDQRLLSTLDAFKAIARIMKEAPGEKNLLWVTAGFRVLSRFHPDVQDAMRDLAAAKLMLYPIDARGVLAGQGFASAQALAEFAGQTGGRVYSNSNDTAAFLRAALDDSREGYVLTYAPRDYKQDGSAHQVQLKTDRKGVQLRYRPGYVADRAP